MESLRGAGLVSAEAACAYCHLPVPHALSLRVAHRAGPIYCCYGCSLAAQIMGASGAKGHATWMLTRLGLAVVLSMAVMMFSLPLYGFDAYADAVGGEASSALSTHLPGLLRFTSLFLSAMVFVLLGFPILANAAVQLRRGMLSTDGLVVLGVGATLVYSCVTTIQESGDTYFETACMVLVLVTLGRYLEATGKNRATDAIRSLESLLPDEVRVIREGETLTIPRRDAVVGDTVLLAAGDCIPVDGQVASGRAHVDERIVSGESAPIVKQVGDSVRAGTTNLDGALTVMTTAVGRESTIARIAAALEDARRGKGRFERFADRIAGVFVPIVILLALLGGWLAYRGAGVEGAIMTSLSVLLLSCPCALGIATPLAVWVAFDRAGGRGVLFRSGAALEELAAVRAVAFDKTGTLTNGDPTVESFVASEVEPGSQRRLIAVAAGLGLTSSHALSRGIVAFAARSGIKPKVIAEARTLPGRGVVGRVNGGVYHLGSAMMMKEAGLHSAVALAERQEKEGGGERPVSCISSDDHFSGVFTFSESLRGEAMIAIEELKRLGCRVCVLTGDRAGRGEFVSQKFGVETLAELSPSDKVEALKAIRHDGGPVAMVGDGLNDAPALAAADVGLAMGCGADISREAADVSLLGNDLRGVPWSLALARRTVRTIRSNLVWAFAYNGVGIPLALTGKLSPVLAAVAMVISSLVVVANSLRLRSARIEVSM